jgi:hypothetical protein
MSTVVGIVYLYSCVFSIRCSHGSLVAGRLLPVHGCEVDGVSVGHLFHAVRTCLCMF